MKRPFLYLALILTGALFAAETGKDQAAKPTDPLVLAKHAVEKKVVQPLTRHDRPMSRIGPIRPTVIYAEVVEVKGEKRLPFNVHQHRGITLTGYVRLSDQLVAIENTEALQVSPRPQFPFKEGAGQWIRP